MHTETTASTMAAKSTGSRLIKATKDRAVFFMEIFFIVKREYHKAVLNKRANLNIIQEIKAYYAQGEFIMTRKIGHLVVALAVLASATMFMGCLSGVFTYEPAPAPRAAEVIPSIEGTWYASSSDSYFDIVQTGGNYEMICYKLLRDGSKDISKTRMETFEKGEKSSETTTSGYIYGYNKSRPGWIAYYYTVSASTLNLTSLTTVRGGVTWSSLEEAKAGADKNYPGVVKFSLTRK